MLTDGQDSGLTLEGTYIFYSVVMVVNIKILISSFEFTFWMLLFISIGIIGYYGFYMLFSFGLMSSTLYGLMQQTFFMPQNYLVLVFFSFCYIIIDEGLQTANGMVREFLQAKREQFIRAKHNRLKEDKTLDRNRVTNYHHSGYAFSQAPGQDRLVTDNLTNRLKDALAKQLFSKAVLIESQDLADTKSPLPLLKNLSKIGSAINASTKDKDDQLLNN